MAIGKKTQVAPEIGDLVIAKAAKTYLYQDSDAIKIKQEVPSGTELGAIVMIAPNETGVDLYVVDDGAVFADEVTVKANPTYNYGSDPTPTPKTTGDNSGGFWEAFNKVLDLGVGIFTKKKTGTTSTGDREETDVADDEETEAKKGTPTWVWLTIGGVAVTGLIVALVLPKKKPEPTPQQPIILGK